MAFSFRAGTNWCHDFPKLARESGFYFSMHGSKVRVDWNRISTLDIDRVIRERDFSTIDENINNVIDYCLESEYDVKILDVNFVKLFRLAQLSVEYLLYCKQYLDRSVIILKDELRQKIEHNVSTKKEIATLEDTIKSLKERSKEKCKFIETRVGDSSGEIYKCPHCPKTFVSATFVNAHVARRHSYISDVRVVTSPVHEHYRAVTEKLHNEIKTLKERLNQTERVIRNESDKFLDNAEKNFVRNVSENECDVKVDESREQRRYREDIESLRSVLFDEIRKLRRKEHTVLPHDDNSILEASVKALIGQQEKELDSLKSQLLERLTPGIENMQTKLQTQENYWKAKIERMEVQHHQDIEKLITELKITQRAADRIKSEYASKVRDLEKQSLDQSNILVEQGKRLNCLSREISNSQARANYETRERGTMMERFQESPLLKVKRDSVASCDHNETHRMISSSLENSEIVIEDVGSESSQEHSDESVPIAARSKCTLDKKDAARVRGTERFVADFDATVGHAARSNSKNSEILEIITETRDEAKRYDMLKNFDKTNDRARQTFSVKDVQDVSIDVTKKSTDVKGAEGREASRIEDARDDKKSTFFNKRNPDSPSEFSSTSRSESESESITADDDDVTVKEHVTRTAESLDARRASMREDARSMLDNRLRDLGIDPEWHGIPMTTFRQKMEIVRHQRNINAKKWIRYSRIKQKIIADIFRRISTNRIEESGRAAFTNESPLDKLITRVKSKSSKALGGHKNEYSSVQKTMSGKTTSSKLRLKQKIESLPQKYKDNESSLKRNRTDLCTSPKTVTTQSRLTDRDESAHRDTCSATSVDSPKRVKQISSTKIIVSDSNVHKVNSPISGKRMEEMVVPKFSRNNDDTSDDTTVHREDSVEFSKSKESRSVLKPTSGSLGSLVKKKVLFDLQDERNDATISKNDGKKDQKSESDWLVSSLPEERENTLQRDKFMSTGNIVLRTSQSDKIAEISKKIQEQLNTVRRPPVGSIETIFKSDVSLQSLTSHSAGKLFNSTSLENSILEGPVQNFASPNAKNGVPLPQLASRARKDQDSTDPRRENEFSIFKYTDLDSDIDEILQME